MFHAFKQVIKINPDDSKSWYNIEVSLDKLGRQPAAIKAYDKSTSIKLTNNTENGSD